LDAIVIILALILNPRANRRRKRAAELRLVGQEPELTTETSGAGTPLSAALAEKHQSPDVLTPVQYNNTSEADGASIMRPSTIY